MREAGTPTQPEARQASGLLKSGTWAVAGQLLNRAAAFVLTVVCARELGAEDFTQFGIFANAALFAAAFGLPGLDTAIIRSSGADAQRVVRLKVCAVAVLYSSGSLLAYFAMDYSAAILLFAGVSGVSQAISEVPEGFFVIRGQMALRAAVQSLPSVAALSAAGLYAVVSSNPQLWPFMAFAAGRDLIRLALGGMLSLGSGRSSHRDSSDRSPLLWLALISLLGYIYYRVDVVVLAGSSARDAIGLYAAAYAFIFALQNLPNALAPLLLRRFVADLGARSSNRILKAQLGLGVAAAMFVLVFAGPLVQYVYGPDFVGAERLLRILALTLPLLYANSALLRLVLSQTMDKQVVFLLSVVAAAAVLLNILLVSALEVDGACWASVAVEAMLTGGLWRMVRRRGREAVPALSK